MAAVDLSLLGGSDLPDLRRYRAALSRSSVALSSEFNLPTDRHLLATSGAHRADQRQRFQRPFSAAQRELDGEAAASLGRLNLRPFSSASTREVIAEAQRIVDKYRERTLSGRWPTDAATRSSLESARRVAPAPRATPQPPPPPPSRQSLNVGEAADRQQPLRSPAALFSDPRRRSLATPLASQELRWRSRTEVEARRQAMRILRDVGLSDAYRSHAEVEDARASAAAAATQLDQPQQPPHQQPPQQFSPLQPSILEEFAAGPRPLRTPLASSGYASYEDFLARTGPRWRHPLPSHVAAGFCDEDTRQKVWTWLTESQQLDRHGYLMKLCD